MRARERNSTPAEVRSSAATLLEPESDDGLVAWNFLDRYLAGSFGRSAPFPIYKLMEPADFVRVTLARD